MENSAARSTGATHVGPGPDTVAPNPPNVSQGITRRPTKSALERLSRVNGGQSTFSAWYEPGLDYCFYAAADTAFKATEGGLKKLKLTTAERKALTTTKSLAVVIGSIRKVQAAHEAQYAEDSVLMARVSRLTNSFCDYAARVAGIVNILLPQSPEYTVTFGLLEIIFKAVVDKKDKQMALAAFLESVTAKLPLLEFYESIFPTNAMKTTVASLYVEILTFLDAATRYYCTGRFTKFVDAIFQPIETQFAGYVAAIGEQTKRMNDLAQAAQAALTRDTKDKVDNTGFVVSRIYENLEGAVSALSSSLALVNHKVENLSLSQSYITVFHAKSYVQTLQQEAFPEISSTTAELDQLSTRNFSLKPRDRWDQNGILSCLSEWSSNNRQASLWIGGRSGNQEPWVTEMSVDLIRALQSQEKTAIHVFCDGPPESQAITPSGLARRLIVQFLASFPLIAFHAPELFNSRKLSTATSFAQLWEFCRALASQVGETFFIIDRLDRCKPDSDADIETVLLPALMELAQEFPYISLIMTADRAPPASLQANEGLVSVWINTAVSAAKRNNKWG